MLAAYYPRPVPIDLGTPPRAYEALPLRVRDLADLEALAAAAWADPTAGLPDDDPDTPAHAAALERALSALESDPHAPGWGSDHCARVAFGTVGGRAAFLCAVLRSSALAWDAAIALAPAVTPGQWSRLDRIAFGVGPQSAIVARADALAGVGTVAGDGEPVTWAEAVADACERLGCPPDALLDLPLPALSALARGGKPANPWGSGGTPAQGRKRQAWWDRAKAAASI